MVRRFDKVVSLILVVVLSLTLISCSERSAGDIIGNAASTYGDGMSTESVYVPDMEKTLNDMIKEFSGSYYYPEEDKLTDDEFVKLMRRLFDPDFKLDDQTPTPVPTEIPTPSPEPTPTVQPTVAPTANPTSTPIPKETSKTTGKPTKKPTQKPTKKPTKRPTAKSTAIVTALPTKKPTKKPTNKPTAKPTAKVTTLKNQVSNLEELYSVLLKAMQNTETEVVFTFVNGFNYDINGKLNEIHTELQRRDPLNVSGVKRWSWNSYGKKYALVFHYHYDVDEFKRMKKKTIELVNKAVEEIKPNGKSDYEIVCAVNNYLCDKVYYPKKEPYPPVSHTAYGALYNGCAVCEGYACAACLILRACGIECDIEVGKCTESGGGHAWNLVKVNGKWYQLDVTWNDGGGKRTKYLLVSDSFMRKSRNWETGKYPKCNTEYAA